MNLAADAPESVAGPAGSISWGIGDHMTAMARMYELTGDTKYVDHLHDLAMIVLKGRDDNRTDSVARADGLRRSKIMHAWGMKGVATGDYYTSSITVAGNYAYPIATFARIVAENPALQAQYGQDAKEAATALIDTYTDFLPELVSIDAGGDNWWNYWTNPTSWSLQLTPDRCQWAYNAESVPGDQALNDTLQSQLAVCNEQYKDGGQQVAFNETLIFVRMLVELSRALDTPFYAPDPDTRRFAESVIPTIAAHAMRYYRSSGFPGSQELCGLFGLGCHYGWIYSADPIFNLHMDDADEGRYEMYAMGLLWRNKPRLDALLAAHLGDSIALSQDDLTSAANTFLQKLGPTGRDHLYQNFDGTVPSPVDALDGTCAGWLELAAFNVDVFTECEKILFAAWDPSLYTGIQPPPSPAAQPHLDEVNHAALLAVKPNLPTPSVSARQVNVSSDAASGWYTPAGATEWTNLLQGTGIAIPDHLYLAQEASGNLLDSMGTAPFVVVGSGLTYQDPVPGWSRTGVKWTDNLSTYFSNEVVTNNTSSALLIIASIDATPSGSRTPWYSAADVVLLGGAQFRVDDAGSAYGTLDPVGNVHAYLLRNSQVLKLTSMTSDQETITPSWANVANGTFLGGVLFGSPAMHVLYVAQWVGPGADLTAAQATQLINLVTNGHAP
jgi:hypothetical protein